MGIGIQTGTRTGTENDNSPKFEGGSGYWDVLKYLNGDVSRMENDNCLKLSCIINHHCPHHEMVGIFAGNLRAATYNNNNILSVVPSKGRTRVMKKKVESGLLYICI